MANKAFWIGALLLGSGAALAADDTLERARRCASQPDSLQRLICYDGLFAPGAAVATVVPEPAPAAAAAVVVPAAPAIATVIAPPAPAASANRPQALLDEGFGADQIRRLPSEADENDSPKSLTAAVQQLRETRPNVFRITLVNGQVWQQMDMDTLFHVQVGDTVEISRGKMGGYRMARQNRGGSGWVRVNRVK
jgi:hypothetical protein